MAFPKKRKFDKGVYDDLELIKEVFDKFGVQFRIVYGLLLGMYRDGSPLPDDDDIDLAVVDEIDFKTRKEIGWALLELGFQPQPIAFNVFGRLEPSEPGYNGDGETGIIVCERNFKFTIFFFTPELCAVHKEYEMVCRARMGAPNLIMIPQRFFTGENGEVWDEIKINKKYYGTPAPIEDYLNYSYFGNYKDKKDRRHSPLFNEQHAQIS